MTAKWTKREINAMTSAITSFLVRVRPVDGSSPTGFIEKLNSVLKEKRAEIITSGLRDMVALASDRLISDRDSIAHFQKHPEVYGKSTPEIIARCEKSAIENEKAIAWTNKLLARITSESLPDAVTNFDPLKR